jgi:hypothetical protein
MDSVRLHGVQFRGDVRPAAVAPLWEFPAIEIVDKIEQAPASSASASLQQRNCFSCGSFSARWCALPCLSCLLLVSKDLNGRMADSSVAEIGRAKSDGTVGKTKKRNG